MLTSDEFMRRAAVTCNWQMMMVKTGSLSKHIDLAADMLILYDITR